MSRTLRNLGGLLLAGALGWIGCGDSDDADGEASGGNGGSSAAGGSSASGGSSADASTTTDAPTGSDVFGVTPDGAVSCGGVACKCDNGIDDDGDGLVDGLDPECTGPFDDDEGSFATGIPGDNIDFCQDCFFDGNSGHGDDGCQYHTDCLYGEEPPGGGSECFNCEVTEACVNFCQARTPNGCDCFGCCEVTTSAAEPIFVYLASTCSMDKLDDTEACPRCVQTTQCGNECGRCELCPGKTEADLPADCATDGGPGYSCEGAQVCGTDQPCPANYYCHLGCCLATVF
jgi:hypothetical protein